MCNSPNCSHDPLDDDISDIFGDGNLSADDIAFGVKLVKEQLPERFETKCSKCGGSGRFYGYTGRLLGNCFTCKGTGVIYTKTDPKVLAANRAKAAEKRAAADASAKAACSAWLEANPAEAEWLREAAGRGFEFASSLWESLRKYGRFTEAQEAAVRNATAKSAARKAQWEAERAEREANKAEVSIDRIAEAFAAAKASRIKWPKLRLAEFVFSPASESGRNAGAIYVKTEDDVYLGKIVDGRFTRSRDCSAEQEARIVEVCADPHAAAVAYGKRTGVCSCCGRELTNAESVALGIGPVCRDKWGWA